MDTLELTTLLDETIVELTDKYDTLVEQKNEIIDDGGDSRGYYDVIRDMEDKIDILESARDVLSWL